MKKTMCICAFISAGLLFAGLNSTTSNLDQPLPDAKQEVHGNIPGNYQVVTNTTEILNAVASNLSTHKDRIDRNTILFDLRNCIWDENAHILYERRIMNVDGQSRLFYIAVTNVDLISLGQPLTREK